jgi:hypothetical protein
MMNEKKTKTPMKMEKKEAMMAKGGMTKKPVLAIMIGMGKPKKDMAKGGMAKKGYAAGGMAMVEKDGKKVPAFAADGVGKMAKGGMTKKK